MRAWSGFHRGTLKFFRRKPRPEKLQDLRAHYRSQPEKKHAIGVRLVDASGRAGQVQLLDVSAGGAAISQASSGSLTLEVGDEVKVIFSSLKAASELQVRARIVNSGGDQNGRFGLQFLDLDDLFEDIEPLFFQLFNRRKWMRALPPLDRRVRLVLLDGGEEHSSALRDLSVQGIGAVAAGSTAEFVNGLEEGESRLILTRNDPPIDLRVRLRHRTQITRGLIFGLSIDWPEGGAASAARQRLEEYVRVRHEEVARWNKASQ